MKISLRHILLIICMTFCAMPAMHCHAQEKNVMGYIIEGKDTIYVDEIQASKVYSRLPKQKGRDWRKYYRLVHNFSKA